MDFYLFVIILLFIFAIGDLIVGVSNDAVNFLNSAIGSKVASYRVIIFVAILGIIIGSMFSSGIMEIARKGIFNPEMFTFDKVMIIFLAVMLTDIVLLDIFNSLGLPTSTTVSIVFELLGASLATGILFTFSNNDPINSIFGYINFSSTASIISGIFLSILIAFTAGTIIQYLSRLVFSFQYEKKVKAFGAVYSGIGLTAIVYFLLLKGLKGTTLISKETMSWITANTLLILLGVFIFTTLLCFVLQKLVKINPLRIVVLAGTFSLAMAFAGNDLVNFIGVPISGFLSYQNWQESGVAANQLYQTYLASEDVIVPNYMLLISGIIMALTIWLSAKAKKVTETEVSLGRQDEGDERFKPNAVSRSIVNTSLMLGNIFGRLIPEKVSRKYNISLEKSKMRSATNVQETPAAFDLVRAANNLIIASILIAWATSMKLPLSTTYVSFMVAMGSSLADKAWGRDSAVYRVAGVLSVIGGWFITAFIAFTFAGIFALILYKGGQIGTILLALAVIIYIIISHLKFSKKEKKDKITNSKLMVLERNDIGVVERNRHMVAEVVKEVAANYDLTMKGLQLKDLSLLELADKNLSELVQYSYKVRSRTIKNIKELQTDDAKVSEILLYSSDFIQDIVQSTKYLSHEGLYYIKNLHELTDVNFFTDLVKTNENMNEFFKSVNGVLESKEYVFDEVKQLRNLVRTFINDTLAKEIQALNRSTISNKLSGLKTTVYLQNRDIQAVLMRIVRLYAKYDKKIIVVNQEE